MKNQNILIIFAVLLLLLSSCSRAQLKPPEPNPKASSQKQLVSKSDQNSCLQAARKLLGPEAVLLKCGRLTDTTHLEAVAGIRVRNLKDNEHGIPVSRLVIIRYGTPRWKVELNVDVNDEITNDAGYVGINFIDDSHRLPYYRVSFSDDGAKWGARVSGQLTLVVFSMTRDGRIDTEDIGLGIGWNPAVGRFQEIEPNGEEFAPEVKTPKHVKATTKP